VVYKKRWYDRDPKVSEAIWVWEKFPRDVRLILANFVYEHVQEKRRQARLSGKNDHVSRLSNERVMGLYLSGRKRRWYDQEPETRRAVNALALLSPKEMNDLAMQVLEIKEYIEQQAMAEYNLSSEEILNVVHSVLSMKRKASENRI